MKNKFSLTIGSIILAIGILFAGWYFFVRTTPRYIDTTPTVQDENINGIVQVNQQIIANDPRSAIIVDVTIRSGETVLDALKAIEGLAVETEEYSYGILVESIDGVKNGTDNKYWLYTINGEEATVGADQYQPENNDLIIWEFKAYEE